MGVQKCMVVLLLTVLLVSTASVAASAQKSPGTVKITSPAKNSTVGSTVSVNGKAQLGSGYTLWVLPYDGITGRYYPQGTAVTIRDASWSSRLSIDKGMPVGQKLLIQAVVANKNANNALNRYVSSGQKAGITRLPAGAQTVEAVAITYGTSSSAKSTSPTHATPRTSTTSGSPSMIPIMTQNVSAAPLASTGNVAQASASAAASQSPLPGFEAIYAFGALAIAFVLVLKGRLLSK